MQTPGTETVARSLDHKMEPLEGYLTYDPVRQQHPAGACDSCETC